MSIKKYTEIIDSIVNANLTPKEAALKILAATSDNFEEKLRIKRELIEAELEFDRIDNELQIEIGKDTRLSNDSQRRSALNIKRASNERWVELKENLIPDYKAEVERAEFNDRQLSKLFSVYSIPDK
jgi:hypothetical protein